MGKGEKGKGKGREREEGEGEEREGAREVRRGEGICRTNVKLFPTRLFSGCAAGSLRVCMCMCT